MKLYKIELRHTAAEAKEIFTMAFTRSFLSGLGIEPDKIAAIMETHVEVVNGLKEKINDSGEKADRIKELETELAKAKSDLKAAGEKIKEFESDDSKEKLKSLSEEFEKYKADIASKETDAKSRRRTRLPLLIQTAMRQLRQNPFHKHCRRATV